jgi:hypothetical protein
MAVGRGYYRAVRLLYFTSLLARSRYGGLPLTLPTATGAPKCTTLLIAAAEQ